MYVHEFYNGYLHLHAINERMVVIHNALPRVFVFVCVCLFVCDSECAHLDAKVVRLQHG